RVDLLDVLVVELVDRMERLRLAVVPATDGRHEEIARLREPAELVQMAVDVVRDERDRVVVGGPEGPAGVDAHEQGRGRRLGVVGFRGRDDDRDAQERGGDQPRDERAAHAPHSVACFRGAWYMCNVCKICQVCVTSLPSLKGSENTWREATRTMP